MATLETIQQVLLTLSAAYEHVLNESTIAVYACGLEDVPDEALKKAAGAHISRNRFFPRISELRELALSGRYPDPVSAWGEVLQEVKRVGYYGKPDFSNELITRAVSDLGWVTICQSENLPSERARFIQAYEALLRRETERRVAFPGSSAFQLAPGAQPIQAVLKQIAPKAKDNGAHEPSAEDDGS